MRVQWRGIGENGENEIEMTINGFNLESVKADLKYKYKTHKHNGH